MSEQTSRSLPIPKAKRGVKSFFEGVKREMRKVTWPTYQETNRLFGVVVVVCLLLIVMMTGLGYVFDTLIGLIIKTGGK
ncbi:MAG: preprotein translocase subunit SecE [Armatimonadetes bacterium]|nr:preprotein translocase subunit SecE [Armatimonadota bacterium]